MQTIHWCDERHLVVVGRNRWQRRPYGSPRLAKALRAILEQRPSQVRRG